MEEKKRFSISGRNKKGVRKSLDELMKEEDSQIIGDDIQGGWTQYNSPTEEDEKHPQPQKRRD